MFSLFIGVIDWGQIGYAALGAFFGAILGVISTLLFTAHQNKQRKQFAKTAIADRLHFNSERATQMLGQFGTGGSPNYLLDTTSMVIWLTFAADIIDNELIKALNWHRYQLDHLNAKLSVYYITKDHASRTTPDTTLAELKKSICDHLQIVIGGTCELEKQLLAQ